MVQRYAARRDRGYIQDQVGVDMPSTKVEKDKRGHKAAEKRHKCPYKYDIGNDHSTCWCCDECKRECSDEI